jgi:hypothetical protein
MNRAAPDPSPDPSPPDVARERARIVGRLLAAKWTMGQAALILGQRETTIRAWLAADLRLSGATWADTAKTSGYASEAIVINAVAQLYSGHLPRWLRVLGDRAHSSDEARAQAWAMRAEGEGASWADVAAAFGWTSPENAQVTLSRWRRRLEREGKDWRDYLPAKLEPEAET